LTPIVLDASAGVELALQTPTGRRLRRKLPDGVTSWVPEHYYAEAVAVLRRQELHQRYDSSRIEVALDRLLSAPTRRVSVRPLIPEAWRWRANLTMADALYVIVAQHVGCELVTVDLRLAHRPKVLRSPALWYGLRLVSSLVGPYSVAHPVRFASRSLSEHGSAALGSPPAAPGPP